MSIYAPFCAPEHRSPAAMDQHRRHRLAHGAMWQAQQLARESCTPAVRKFDEAMIREAADALIAAAPELLAALRDLTSAEGLPDGYADRKALITSARAAIAKVEGRS